MNTIQQGPLTVSLSNGKLTLFLVSGLQRWKKAFSYEELPQEITNSNPTLEDIFSLFKEPENFIIQEATGAIIMIMKGILRNKVTETPVQLKLEPDQNQPLVEWHILKAVMKEVEAKIQKTEKRIGKEGKTIIENLSLSSHFRKNFETLLEEETEANRDFILEKIEELKEAEKKRKIIQLQKMNIVQEMKKFKNEFDQWRKYLPQRNMDIQKIKVKVDSNLKYKGRYENNLKTGFGKLSYICKELKGDKYEGYFKDDKFHGKGVYLYNNHDMFEGEWENGQKNGRGIYYQAAGNRYEGFWSNNKKNGKGIYFWRTGDWEEGEYKNGYSHGKAIFHKKDGQQEERTYKNGKMQ